MGSTLEIDWGNLERMLFAMEQVGDQATEVDTYFGDAVCSKAGFDYDSCALQPIGSKLPTVAGWFSQMRGVFDERWEGVEHAIRKSAHDVDALDGALDHQLSRLFAGTAVPGPVAPEPQGFGGVEAFEVSELGDLLAEPGEGERKLPGHDKEFVTIAEGWDAARDTINEAIDKVNGILPDTPVPRLQVASLEDYIVFPLSGNYRALQGNAEACRNVEKAMSTWGNNFSKLSVKVVCALKGGTQEGLVAQLNLYNLVMTSIGGVVGAGSKVFDTIAAASERIAIRVEKAIIVLGRKLLKLVGKVSSRILSWFGWALLVKDLATKGLAAITDIVDEVKACFQMIEACFDLVEEIKAWAKEQAEALNAFKDLVTVIKQLPTTKVTDTLTDLGALDLGPIKEYLKSYEVEVPEVDPEVVEELDDALDGLVEDSGYEPGTAGLPEVDDDEVILAPGPLGEPYSSGPPGVSA